MLGKIKGRRREGATEVEVVGWHGPKFVQTQGDGEGQGSLACCSSWGGKEWDTTSVQQQQQQKRYHLLTAIGLPRWH